MSEAIPDSDEGISEDAFMASLLEPITEDEPSPPADEPSEAHGDLADSPAQPDAPEDAAHDEVAAEPVADAQATTDEAPASDAAPADPTPTPEPQPDPEPWQFTVDGKRIAPEGATLAGDTITITRDVWQRQVQPFLANRAEIAKREQAFRQRIEQKSAREAQSEALIEQFKAISQQDEAAVIEWALSLKDKMPLVLKDAEIAALKAQAQPYQEQAQAEEAALTDAQVEEWLGNSFEYHLTNDPQFAAVRSDGAYRTRALEVLAFALPSILTRTTDAQGRPQLVANWDRFKKIMHREAEVAEERAATAKRLAEIEKAAKANAEKATAAKKAPPAVSAQGRPAGATERKKPATKEEFEKEFEALMRGDI